MQKSQHQWNSFWKRTRHIVGMMIVRKVCRFSRKKWHPLPLLFSQKGHQISCTCWCVVYRAGVVLMQEGGKGIDPPITFTSRRLPKAEKNYSTTKREGLVMVYVLQKYYHYLLGGYFKMYTDHCALKYPVNKHVLGGRICRWLLLFQEYDFEVIVKSGRLNAGEQWGANKFGGRTTWGTTLCNMRCGWPLRRYNPFLKQRTTHRDIQSGRRKNWWYARQIFLLSWGTSTKWETMRYYEDMYLNLNEDRSS